MKYLIHSEVYKTMKQKYFLILMFIAAIIGVITIGLNQLLVISHPNIANTGSDIFVSSLSNISICIIFCTIFIHFHIGSEFTNRTITIMMENGFSRKDIYLSKVIIVTFYCVGLMLVYSLVSTLSATCLNGWGNNISIVNMIEDVFIFLIANLSTLTICIVIEFLVESNTISLIFNILLIGIGSEILLGISKEIPVLEKILEFTPISKINLIGRTTMKTIDLVNGVLVSIIFGIVILLIGYCRFRKLDIK